jgi:glycosyltransferase involved in cell wall biosynthesis
MAWHSGEWIKNCNPSKTLEYLALGKPIVSVPIPELQENFSEFIEFAETPMSFVEKCNLALKNNNEEQIQRRKSFAKNNDWNFKIQKIFNLIYE